MSTERIQALRMWGGSGISVIGPPSRLPNPVAWGSIALVRRRAVKRFGRTQVTNASRVATNATSVVAMAGNVRRMITPAVTPRTNAYRA